MAALPLLIMNQPFRKKNHFHRRRHRGGEQSQGNKNSHSKGESFLEKVVIRYDQLQESHIQARKKYFELYFRADPQQRDKLERIFDRTLLDLREFEKKLSEEEKEFLKMNRDNLVYDDTYSLNHNLNPDSYSIEDNMVIEDPHVLQSQVESDFAKDKEESLGSFEDYKKYKGQV